MKKWFTMALSLVLAVSLSAPILPVHAAQSVPSTSVQVYLDGQKLRHPDTQPCIMNDRTMVPIYQLTKALGANVVWDGAARTVTITRANTTIFMTIDSTTAYVNGDPVTMDVAPCILNDRTMIPAAYVALFFGQTVTWDGEARIAYISEDKTVAGDSNLEAWAIPMGYYLNSPHVQFGGYPRSYVDAYDTTPEMLLADSWSITNRQELIETVLSMTVAGHNVSFLSAAAIVDSLSASEYKQLLAESEGMDAYMWPYTKELSKKWADRGILCWDLFRMSNLVQWGYKCGYITYAEALVLLEPAVTLLKENFSSWDEAFENYVDGYNWWARNDVSGQDTWETSRGLHYQMYKKQYGSQLFNDDLFKNDVIPVPGLTLDDILAALS